MGKLAQQLNFDNRLSLTRPAWAGYGRFEAYKHKHCIDYPYKVIENYYVKSKGLK